VNPFAIAESVRHCRLQECQSAGAWHLLLNKAKQVCLSPSSPTAQHDESSLLVAFITCFN
jgi:hypothetical protein